MKRFGEKLEKAMSASGMNPYRLSEELGKKPSDDTISRWLNGKAGSAKLSDIARVARALEISIDYLVNDEVNEPQPRSTSPAVPLSDKEQMVLTIARSVEGGLDEAIARMVNPHPRVVTTVSADEVSNVDSPKPLPVVRVVELNDDLSPKSTKANHKRTHGQDSPIRKR